MSRRGHLTEKEGEIYESLTFRRCQEDYTDVSMCDCPWDCLWVQLDEDEYNQMRGIDLDEIG